MQARIQKTEINSPGILTGFRWGYFKRNDMYTNENIMCKCCKGYEFYQSDIDGYQGMCDACAAWLISLEMEAEWDAELAVYGKRTGVYYNDFNDFYWDCYNDTIEFRHLNGLVELTQTYFGVIGEKIWNDYEQQLFENSSTDLPF